MGRELEKPKGLHPANSNAVPTVAGELVHVIHPDSSLEEEFVAALQSHFRVHGMKAIEQLSDNPIAYLRLVAAVRDRRRYDDALDKMTDEELQNEIDRTERRLAAAKKKAQIP